MKVIHLKSLDLRPQLLQARQANGTLGIVNVNLIVSILVTFVVDILAVIKERDYFALFRIIPALIAQGNIVTVAAEAWEEIKDTTLEESNDIHRNFTEVLDLKDDEAEQLIEDAFGLVPKAYGIVINALTVVASARELYEEGRALFGTKDKSLKIATKAKVTKLVTEIEAPAAAA